MPRLFAQNRTSMWEDDDFRALSAEAQNLYNYLLAHKTTTYAGVADWFPKRLAHVNTSWTPARVVELGRELAAGHFVVIDEDWDEVCVRSFLRWEQVLKAPNLARAVVHAFDRIESPRLQRVIIHEMLRLREEQPDWPAWEIDGFESILTRRPPLDGKTIDAPINTSPMGSEDPSPDPTPKGSRKGSPNPSPEGSPVTSNKQPVTGNPQPGTSNPQPAAERGGDEFSARARLRELDLDFTELRKVIVRACDREPSPAQVVAIGELFLSKAGSAPEHPLAYLAKCIRADWAVVQQTIDEAGAA